MSYIVRCDRCDYEAQLDAVSLPRYDLGDGDDHYMHTQYAWCHRCRSMVDAEKLPTAAELAELRAQLMRSVGKKDLVTEHVLTEADVDRMALPMERWLAKRRSPPRCLACGATEIVPHEPPGAPEDGPSVHTPFVHPGCGGTIAWFIDFSVECRGRGPQFDPEGYPRSPT
jgi:hypothetical protein